MPLPTLHQGADVNSEPQPRQPRSAIVLALFGALLMVGGLAARAVASRHRLPHPTAAHVDFAGHCVPGAPSANFVACGPIRVGWSATTYDLVRIGGWALLIFGAVIIAFALAREFKRPA